VKPANVITHDEKNVGFFCLCFGGGCRQPSEKYDNSRQRKAHSHGPLHKFPPIVFLLNRNNRSSKFTAKFQLARGIVTEYQGW
jgi:hypothetical protein